MCMPMYWAVEVFAMNNSLIGSKNPRVDSFFSIYLISMKYDSQKHSNIILSERRAALAVLITVTKASQGRKAVFPISRYADIQQ